MFYFPNPLKIIFTKVTYLFSIPTAIAIFILNLCSKKDVTWNACDRKIVFSFVMIKYYWGDRKGECQGILHIKGLWLSVILFISTIIRQSFYILLFHAICTCVCIFPFTTHKKWTLGCIKRHARNYAREDLTFRNM